MGPQTGATKSKYLIRALRRTKRPRAPSKPFCYKTPEAEAPHLKHAIEEGRRDKIFEHRPQIFKSRDSGGLDPSRHP